MKEIFGRDLLDVPGLLHSMAELTGLAPEKPFECVGTLEEVNAAMTELIRQNGDDPLSFLTEYYQDHIGEPASPGFQAVLQQYNDRHFLEQRFETILRRALHG
jgi:hypothetical protein